MRRSASEILRNLEMRVARLEKSAQRDFVHKTIFLSGKKLYFAFVTADDTIKDVSWKTWSKSKLPDLSSDNYKKALQTALVRKANKEIQFNVLIDLNKHRGDFFKTMNWLDKHGIKVTSRGFTVY